MMPAFLLPLLGGWRPYVIAGLAAAVLAVGAYIAVLRAGNEALRSENARLDSAFATAARAAADNAREIARQKSEHLADMLMLEEHARLRIEAAASDARILEEVENAPESDDGPVAPVLRRALDRMRGAAGGRGGAGQDGTGSGPGPAPGVRGSPSRT